MNVCHADYGSLIAIYVLILKLLFFTLTIMVLSFSTFNCRGLQDSFKRKTVFSHFHKKKDDIFFYRKLTVLLLMKNFGLLNGEAIHGFLAFLPTADGWLFSLSLIITFL